MANVDTGVLDCKSMYVQVAYFALHRAHHL